MAKRPTLTDITAAFASASKTNANFDAIEVAFDNTVSRDGSTPNTMSADFDMNNNDILNVKELSSDSIRLDGTLISTSVNSIPAGSVDTTELAAGAVTLPKLGDVFVPRADIGTTTIDADLDYLVTSGYTTSGDGGGATYKRVVAEPSHEFKVQSADGAWWEGVYEGFVLPEQFGAVADGVTDDGPAFQDALDYLATLSGGRLVGRNGTYHFTTQVNWPTTVVRGLIVDLFGSAITTAGSIFAFKVSQSSNTDKNIIQGGTWNMQTNASALGAININGAERTVVRDLNIRIGDQSTSFAGVLVDNEDPADTATGAFWCSLERITVRYISGSRSGTAIKINGNANGTNISYCNLSGTDNGLVLTGPVVSGAAWNGIKVIGNSFEAHNTAAVTLDKGGAALIGGGTFVANRFENNTVDIDLTNSGANSNNEIPLSLIGDMAIGTFTITNPSDVLFLRLNQSLAEFTRHIAIPDGVSAPAAKPGFARLFVQGSDGDLKVIFSDGTVKTIVTDT